MEAGMDLCGDFAQIPLPPVCKDHGLREVQIFGAEEKLAEARKKQKVVEIKGDQAPADDRRSRFTNVKMRAMQRFLRRGRQGSKVTLRYPRP